MGIPPKKAPSVLPRLNAACPPAAASVAASFEARINMSCVGEPIVKDTKPVMKASG
ncbi:hypothetical protein D3C73_1559280 [compost metagenome]